MSATAHTVEAMLTERLNRVVDGVRRQIDKQVSDATGFGGVLAGVKWVDGYITGLVDTGALPFPDGEALRAEAAHYANRRIVSFQAPRPAVSAFPRSLETT